VKKPALIIAIIAAFSAIYADDAQPLTYDECVSIALANSPAHKMQAEKYRQAQLSMLSAVGSFLPTVTLNHSRYYGEDFTNTLDNTWQSSFEGYAPLFTGFSRVTGFMKTASLAVKEEYALKAAEKQVKEDAADAFFKLAAAQAELLNSQEALNLMQDREKELTQREALGKSRTSELYSVQSSAAVYAAQLESAKSSGDKAADALASLLGTGSAAIVQPLETADETVQQDANALAACQPSVKSAAAEAEAMGRNVLYQESSFLPEVGLMASKALGGSPYRGDDLTFYVTASWRVFDGGQRVLGTIAAFSEEERLRQKARQVLLDAVLDVKSKLRDYEASKKRVESLKTAYEKSSKSFKLMQKDYRYGMATNIEVIQAMTEMINVKKALDNEIITKEKNKVLLEILK
jgi:outer membrane protein